MRITLLDYRNIDTLYFCNNKYRYKRYINGYISGKIKNDEKGSYTTVYQHLCQIQKVTIEKFMSSDILILVTCGSHNFIRNILHN